MEAAPATDALICLYTNLNLKKIEKKIKNQCSLRLKSTMDMVNNIVEI